MITGGSFQNHNHMDTYVMISYKNIGPKMCVKECMSHNGCNSVNFRTETLVCESLTVSYPGDQLSNVSGYSFTEINRWTQVGFGVYKTINKYELMFCRP